MKKPGTHEDSRRRDRPATPDSNPLADRMNRATNLLADHQMRRAIIDTGGLGEQVWDILMCAYLAQAQDEQFTAAILQDRTRQGAGTASRIVKHLLATGHFSSAGGTDGGNSFRITSATMTAMEAYLDRAPF